jgi:CxxC motif-containing protein (DUF1111 family)
MKKILILLAWALWILIVWVAITVIVNAVPPGGIPPGQAKKQGLDKLPPGLAKKLTAPTPVPPPPGATPTPALTGFGALIKGVTPQEKADWTAGRVQFQVVETAPGLGPLFNGQSCQQCHGQPQVNGVNTIGGPAPNIEIHFFSPAFGTQLFHLSSTTPTVQDQIPADATVVVARKSNTTAGLGLIENIPDAAIIANAQTGKDGVFGRPAILQDTVTQIASPNRVGRFGWKCQHASTIAFAGDALINELGLTNRLFSTDLAPNVTNGFALLTAAEPPGITPTTLQDLPDNPALPESETNPDRVEKLHDFMQFNAAPPPVSPLSQSALAGQSLFTSIGCVRCHTPSYTTGAAGGSVALAFQNVALYSDLRLHHMGTLGDGISQGAAGPDEMRTAPLWGLRARSPFLHDGRADTITEAIQAHNAPGAESAIIARRFEALPQAQQQQILDFLNSI